jgi:hypothetical protein
MKSKIPDLVKLVTTVDLTDLTLPWNNFGGKAEFHKWGKQACKEIATALGLPKGTYDIRSNPGGVAVSGEVTLHAENLYLQLSTGIDFGRGREFMFRRCNGRSDYTGQQNQWVLWESLANDFEGVISQIKHIL